MEENENIRQVLYKKYTKPQMFFKLEIKATGVLTKYLLTIYP